MNAVDLYPAIDLLGGRVVRLRQGSFEDSTVYGDDPVAVARRFARDGCRRVHLVDLDAARTGDPVNRRAIADVVAAVAGPADDGEGTVTVQVGGGVRDIASARVLADLGVGRVVVGSAAVVRPELVEELVGVVDVAVGLDHRGGVLAVHGWTEVSAVTVGEMLPRFPTAAAFVITDINRDGMLMGPDLEGLRQAVASTDIPVIASGGVGSLKDLGSLAAIDGLAGVITGKALYEGRFTVAEALAVLGG